MPFLSSLGIKGILYIVAAVAFMAALGTAIHEIKRAGALEEINAELQKTNRENVAQLAKIQADAKRAEEASASDAQRLVRRNTEKQSLQDRIASSVTGDDGKVAPVLQKTLDALWPVK